MQASGLGVGDHTLAAVLRWKGGRAPAGGSESIRRHPFSVADPAQQASTPPREEGSASFFVASTSMREAGGGASSLRMMAFMDDELMFRSARLSALSPPCACHCIHSAPLWSSDYGTDSTAMLRCHQAQARRTTGAITQAIGSPRLGSAQTASEPSCNRMVAAAPFVQSPRLGCGRSST